MKTRIGFVSNSSSSSFIILNDESIIPKGVTYAELTVAQKKRLVSAGFITKSDIKDKVFLTEFISDCRDIDDDSFYTDEYEVTEFGKSKKLKDNVKEYHNGGHGCPYEEDNYDEIAERVYIEKAKKKRKSRAKWKPE